MKRDHSASLAWRVITERGVGNGISLLIFGGIVGRFPSVIDKQHPLRPHKHQLNLLILWWLSLW